MYVIKKENKQKEWHPATKPLKNLYDLKNTVIKILAHLENLFVPLSLKSTRNNRSSPHNGPIKNCLPQNLNI
jgi:hypothetical protein